MQQRVAEAGFRLEGMPESVAQIEQGAASGLALVRRHDIGLRLATHGDGMGERVILARQHPRAVLLQPAEEVRPVYQAVFHDLRVAGPEFAVGQGGERGRVGEHETRLVEGADEVLALRRVDRRLASDGAVHLRKQRRGDLHIVYASQQDGRGKSRKVADHTAAERENAAAPVQSGVQQPIQQVFQMAEGLGCLPRRQHNGCEFDARGIEPRGQPAEMVRGHVMVRDDRDTAAPEHRQQPVARAFHQSGSGQNVVAAFAEADLDLPHRLHRQLSTRPLAR